ncbi:MAG TPA: hypothetical protein PKD72_03560, partial [Gemmatales bacterium]|nr:hypothetical protein [Gemmatales bacterium]
SPRQQLEEALQLPVEQLTPIDLDHLLRAYLASRSNPLWLSTPQLEAENLWQELLPVSDSAHSWHMRFCTLEERKYTQNTAQNTDVQLYLQAIRELLLTLDDHDKLMKQKNF